MKITQEKIWQLIEELGWDELDDITIETSGSSTYEIDGPGTKWSPKQGAKKYNKDAFIVIKNQSRRDNTKSIAPE